MYVIALANKGFGAAIADDSHLAQGVNVHQGEIKHEAVARELLAA